MPPTVFSTTFPRPGWSLLSICDDLAANAPHSSRRLRCWSGRASIKAARQAARPPRQPDVQRDVPVAHVLRTESSDAASAERDFNRATVGTLSSGLAPHSPFTHLKLVALPLGSRQWHRAAEILIKIAAGTGPSVWAQISELQGGYAFQKTLKRIEESRRSPSSDDTDRFASVFSASVTSHCLAHGLFALILRLTEPSR